MSKEINYRVTMKWTGNKGAGTSGYKSYDRNYELHSPGKPTVPGSSDPAYRGDKTRYNPEELLVSSLSACHMLWYLHLCAEAGVVVISYNDEAKGRMTEDNERGGWFTEVQLFPKVEVTKIEMVRRAQSLHHKAHAMCFIANSVNFPVTIHPACVAAEKGNDANTID